VCVCVCALVFAVV